MAKFFYKMQNILDIKEKLETQAKNDYAVANAVLAEEEEKLETLEERRAAYEGELRRMCTGNLDLHGIAQTSEAVELMKYHKRLQEVNVMKARKNAETARQKLQEAMQERKTHEKLKENAFEAFKMEVSASESKEVDELVSYRHGS